MSLKLSVLDQSPVSAGRSRAAAIENSLTLAVEMDRAGYQRYWFAEHHASPGFAGDTPEIMVALALERTARIRIGSGGVLLPRYPAAKVAETFTVLAAVHGARVDLGLGRAGGPAADYPTRVAELRDRLAPLTEENRPELWLLGAGTGSAVIATELGTGFAYGHFLSPEHAEAAFGHFHTRRSGGVLAVRAIVSDSESRAEELAASFLLWRARKDLGFDEPFPSVAEARAHTWTEGETARAERHRAQLFAGTPGQVTVGLHSLAQRLAVDELMINTPLADLTARIDSNLALAEAWNRTDALPSPVAM